MPTVWPAPAVELGSLYALCRSAGPNPAGSALGWTALAPASVRRSASQWAKPLRTAVEQAWVKVAVVVLAAGFAGTVTVAPVGAATLLVGAAVAAPAAPVQAITAAAQATRTAGTVGRRMRASCEGEKDRRTVTDRLPEFRPSIRFNLSKGQPRDRFRFTRTAAREGPLRPVTGGGPTAEPAQRPTRSRCRAGTEPAQSRRRAGVSGPAARPGRPAAGAPRSRSARPWGGACRRRW